MDEIKVFIPARLKNVAKNGHVAGVEDIYDDALQKTQKEINAEQEGSIAAEVERATGVEEFLQSEVNALSNQNYVTVDSYSELPDLGNVDTVYRVGSWDGTQVDPTKYAEYAWNNTGIDQGEYKLLDVKDYGIDDEPTAGSENLVTSGGIVERYGDYVENPEFVEVHTDAEDKILYGVKADGDFYFGAGIPGQIKDEINTKVDKIPGKGLSTNDYDNTAKEIVDTNEFVENQEYIKVTTDNEGKILYGVKTNGEFYVPQLHSPSMESLINQQVQGVRKDFKEVFDETSDIENRIAKTLDKDGKVISWRKEDGTLVEPRLQVDELILGDKAKESVKKAALTETVIVVDKSGTGDYTSLLEAVMASQRIDKCTIIVNSGEYDLKSEYKAVFGNDYFDNYAANYNGYANGRIDAGLFLWPNVSLKGNGFVRIKFDYTGSNNNVKTYFAPLNTTNNVAVEDITITTNDNMCCRYLIHDDFAQGAGVNIFRNIVFEGNSNGGSIIGAGMGVANTYIVENCYFTNEATFDDINYHNNGSASTDFENLLMVRNCKGGGKCVVQSLGNSDRMTKCIVSNSEFMQILSRRSSSQTYDKDNMELIKFLNNETNV